MANHHYRDSLFRSLFSDKDEALSLYNAFKGTSYGANTPVVLNTLGETVFSAKKNDISFSVDGRIAAFVDHQSTVNNNMPFRFLDPTVRHFENCLKNKEDIFKRGLFRFERPDYYVLYNGGEDYPDYSELRLSDAFFRSGAKDEINLELIVKVYNVNHGHNAEIVEKCRTLREYAEFVDIVQRFKIEERAAHPERPAKDSDDAAMARAITYCKRHGILVEYLSSLKGEEVVMLTQEFTLEDIHRIEVEDARDIALQEGRQQGISEGRQQGISEGRNTVLSLVEKGYSAAQIREMLAKR